MIKAIIQDVRIYSDKSFTRYKIKDLWAKRPAFGSDSDIIVVTMKRAEGLVNDIFPILLKYDGTLQIYAQTRISRLRRLRFINFLRCYGITENIKNYNIVKGAEEWIGIEVKIDREGHILVKLPKLEIKKAKIKKVKLKKTKIIKKEQKKPIKELKPPKKKIKEIKIIKKLKKVVRIRRKPEGKYFKPIPKIKPKIKKKVKIKKRISRIKLKKPVRKIRKPLKKVQKKPEIKAEEKVEKKGLFGSLKEKVAKKLAQQGELFVKTEKLPSLKFGNIITKRMDQITLKDIISHLSLYKKPISYEVINRYMYLTKEQWEKFKELNKGVFQ
ncbi:MAG: hypothetical protein KJ968_04260 [Nanoarchaeota archaeon]|nr:hypothetical protein [Nanoarchaeota archaeon]